MDQFQGTVPHRQLHGDELRYVRLLPGAFDEPITCELVYSAPIEDRSYEALSYAWGDPNETSPITLNGQTFPVTTNLRDALQHLRYADKPRMLWIDALCINQSDLAERSVLIQRMKGIYRLSGTTIAWLGTAAPLQQPVVQHAFNLAARLATLGPTSKGRRILAEQGFVTEHLQVLTYMREICVRRWFFRVWVIQEVTGNTSDGAGTPRQIDLVCGSSTIPLETFAKACMSATNIKHTIGKRMIRNCPVVNVRRVNAISGYLQKQRALDTITLTPAHYLAALLILTSGAESTEAKDNIYALLGLLPEGALEQLPPELSPDYEKADSAVLHSYAVYLIDNAGFIDMMYQSRGRHPLATWIPDWAKMDILARSSHDIAKYCLMSSLGNPRLDSSKTEIEIDGIRRGKVVAVGPILEDLRQSLLDREGLEGVDALRRRYHHVRDHLLACRAAFMKVLQDGGTADTWQEKRRSWLTNIRRSYNGIDQHAFEEVYVKVINEESPDDAFLEETSHMISHTLSRLKIRTSFIDNRGSINITARPSGSSNPELGDELFLLKGSCHQYVLRPVGSGTSWRLVNATYLMPDAFGEFWLDKHLNIAGVKRFWEANRHKLEQVRIL